MKAIKLDLTAPAPYDQALCRLFADTVYETNKDVYAQRQQNDKDKVIQDIYYGKIAEMMLHKKFKELGKHPRPIDFHIYEAKDKSFDCDIQITSSMVHVKSCLNTSAFPNSWLFQPNDPVVTSPTPTDVLALVVLAKDSYCYIGQAFGVSYSNPVKETLNKKVIYENNVVVTQKELY